MSGCSIKTTVKRYKKRALSYPLHLNTGKITMSEEIVRENSLELLFIENQKFRLLWVKIVIGIAAVGAVIPIFLQMTSGQPPVTSPGSYFMSAVFPVIILAGVVLLFQFLELRVRVTPEGITYQFFPLHRKWRRIDADDIVSFENITYRPLLDYGGWGIRYRPGKGTAYNVSGNRGIRIERKNGQKVLFGTLRPDEFESAVTKLLDFHK